MNLDFTRENFRFNARVFALIYNKEQDKVLLFKIDRRDFYMLPGGRIEELESSIDAIKREIKEELGWKDLEFSFLALSEEFVNDKGYNNQQLNIIYKSIYKGSIEQLKFKGLEGDWLNFEWIDANTINQYEIFPTCIKSIVSNENKNNHFIEDLIKGNKINNNKILPLNTDRLIIRKTKLEDVDLLLKMDKQEATQLYLGGIKNKTREERIIFLEKKIAKSKNDKLGALTVCLLDKTPIGFIEFNAKDNCMKISYIFDYEYCNKGYCTEACQKLIDVSFNQLNIKKIYAKTIKDNNRSNKVLSKLNFKLIKQNNIIEENNTFLEYELTK